MWNHFTYIYVINQKISGMKGTNLGEFEELDELLVAMLQQTFNDDNIKDDL